MRCSLVGALTRRSSATRSCSLKTTFTALRDIDDLPLDHTDESDFAQLTGESLN
jgi:hypothetical protein